MWRGASSLSPRLPGEVRAHRAERGSLHFVEINSEHVRDTLGQAMIPNAIRSSLFMIALLSSFALAPEILARDYGQYDNVDPAIREWVQGLKDKTGQGCCATAD